MEKSSWMRYDCLIRSASSLLTWRLSKEPPRSSQHLSVNDLRLGMALARAEVPSTSNEALCRVRHSTCPTAGWRGGMYRGACRRVKDRR